MELWITKAIEASPILGVAFALWYFQRKDYIGLVTRTQEENNKREDKYQATIEKLTEALKAVDTVRTDVAEIKEYIRK